MPVAQRIERFPAEEEVRGSNPLGHANMAFSTPVSKIPNIGSSYESKLKNLKIRTVGDLLYYFPSRYEDLSETTSISSIYSEGRYTIRGKILRISTGRTLRRRIPFSEITIKDGTGEMKAVFLNQPYLAKNLKEGEELLLSGKASYSREGVQFVNPYYERTKGMYADIGITPVYPETKGLSSRWLRSIIAPLLKTLESKIQETLPKEVIKKKQLYTLEEALKEIHFPRSWDSLKKAQERLSFERIFLLQLFLVKQKMVLGKRKSVPVDIKIKEIQKLVSDLPFDLTNAQKKAAWQIIKDLEKDFPMNRLLEGDVGSGKTVVAIIAALSVIKGGYQVAFMAPTGVLSRQHFDEISKLLWRFKIDVGLLTGKKDKLRSNKLKGDTLEISRKKLVEKVKKGELSLLVGTHALIQEEVKFKNLGLVVLDEQHRFGVEQRSKLCLKDDGRVPHLLSMTATPIPRTLTLTVYGDLDLSVINELPKERKKVITRIISPKKRKEAYHFIGKEIEKGRQAFFICPRIEESEDNESPWAGLKSVEKEKERLDEEVFPDLRVELLHGKMKSTEKEKVMKDFKSKKIDILVSPSVIEVGIDIKNASVMVIEGAEMFGLSQLHQFRGRVGRGEFQSYCFLFTSSHTGRTKERLKALLESDNGFQLAEKDLEIRGPGDFVGKRQWGSPDFTMEALKDRELVEEARSEAKEVLSQDPELKEHHLLKRRVDSLEKKFHLE